MLKTSIAIDWSIANFFRVDRIAFKKLDLDILCKLYE